MRAVDIIAKKRDGQMLTQPEIAWFIESYTRDEIPDYQVAAFLMAVCIRGMNSNETTALTLAMANSGDTLDLSHIVDYAVDKHSSGGVGDKTSLVVLPLVASCGVPIAKMSGRGLGYTGGTLDKMESIKGFTVHLGDEAFINAVKSSGLVLAGQTADLAPADGKLYALRDVTATVASIPLIASSIMSKKIAAGANGIVLDVKVGTGAFMNKLDDAHQLAQLMVDIGVQAGRDLIAVISDMNQPLGQAVGNALEVAEAIETLNGSGPADLRQHCLEIAGHMLRLAGRGERWTNPREVETLLVERIDSGAALGKFRQMVAVQGGDTSMVDDPSRLPRASIIKTLAAKQDGYIAQIDAHEIAVAAFDLGAGREKKGDPIDLGVGVIVHFKVGDYIKAGAPLATIHANDPERLRSCQEHLEKGMVISPDPVKPLPLFYETIYGD